MLLKAQVAILSAIAVLLLGIFLVLVVPGLSEEHYVPPFETTPPVVQVPCPSYDTFWMNGQKMTVAPRCR